MDSRQLTSILKNGQAELDSAAELHAALVERQQAVALLEEAEQRVAEARKRLGLMADGGGIEIDKPSSGQKEKLNVDIYVEILSKNGGPMHAVNILERFREDYGREPQGKNKPIEQIRAALANSKRFVNVGDNTWWLPDKPIPDNPNIVHQEVGEEDLPGITSGEIQETFLP